MSSTGASGKAAKTRLSFIIKDSSEESVVSSLESGIHPHRQGINALVLDYDAYKRGGQDVSELSSSSWPNGGFLYSAARDSLINQWTLRLDPGRANTAHSHASLPIQITSAGSGGHMSGGRMVVAKSALEIKTAAPFAPSSLGSPPLPSNSPANQNHHTPESAPAASNNSHHPPHLQYPRVGGGAGMNSSLKRLAHRDPAISASLPALHHLSHIHSPSTDSASSSSNHNHHHHDPDQPSSPLAYPSTSASTDHSTNPSHIRSSKHHQHPRVSFGASSSHRPQHRDSYGMPRPSGVSVEGIHHIPYDNIVQYNKSILAPTPSASISRTFTGHADWVNDLGLRDNGRYLVSCSSDRTVVLWDTLSASLDEGGGGNAVKLGMHGDYVKRLALPKMRNWVCSGGLDRQLLLWDLQETRPTQPQVLYTDDSPFGSVYALATNPTGSLIASGSAQKFISIFDPRAKSAQILQLQGHSNVIRDLLMSDDGKWVLSASSDTTIKLWSLAMPNHCVTTYNHSEAPVWCLATTSPNFETFWAGSKDGWVYKVSCTPQLDDDGRNVDCVALCKETHPVLKIAAIEDAYVWTATTSSSINRWPDIPFTMNPSNFQIPASSICRRESIDEPETESLYSRPVSIRSGMDGVGFANVSGGHFASEPSLLAMPPRTASPDEFEAKEGEEGEALTPLWPAPIEILRGVAGIRKSLLLNNKRHLLTQDTEDVVCVWDIICCCKIKTLGKVDFNKACETENPVEWVANWCTVQTNLGDITVHLDEGRCYDSEVYFQDLLPHVDAKNEDQRVNLGKWILTYLFYDYLKSIYPNNSSFDPNISKPTFNHGGKAQIQINRNAAAAPAENSPGTPSLKVMPASPVGALPGVSLASMGSLSTLPPPLTSNPSAISNNSTSPHANTNIASVPSSVDNLNSGDEATDGKKGRPASFISKLKNFRIRSGSSPKYNNDDGTSSNTNLISNQLKSTEKLIERDDALIFFEECPFITLDPNINIMFSVEESPSIFNDTFQARIGDLGHAECLPNLQTHLPWVYDWLLQGVNPPKDLAKLSFVLVKHSKSNLPEVPAETSRLTANRMLRIRKVIQYLCDKISCTPHPACIGANYASASTANEGKSVVEAKKVYIELYCQGKLLNFRQTLATIKYCVCKTGGTDLVFHYLERKVREAS